MRDKDSGLSGVPLRKRRKFGDFRLLKLYHLRANDTAAAAMAIILCTFMRRPPHGYDTSIFMDVLTVVNVLSCEKDNRGIIGSKMAASVVVHSIFEY